MTDLAKTAIQFVDSLVPGSFEKAKLMLTDDCVYEYGSNTLVGPSNVVAAFEDSHSKAKTTLDAIEYLPAQIISSNDRLFMVGVKDKLYLRNREHVYSDRLEVEVTTTYAGLKVCKVKWCPIAAEREQLNAFRNG